MRMPGMRFEEWAVQLSLSSDYSLLTSDLRPLISEFFPHERPTSP